MDRTNSKGDMATVIGIFEKQFIKNKPLTVVKPGHKLDDLLIFTTLFKFVLRLLKLINVDITTISVTKNYILL